MRALLVLLAGVLSACFGLQSSRAPARRTGPPPAPAYVAPEFNRTAADLDAAVAQMTAKGYQPQGELLSGRLEAFQPLEFAVQRGRCYLVVLRLQQGAQFSEHARRGVGFIFDVGGRAVHGGPGIRGPGGVGSAGCPPRSSAARFDLQAIWGSAMDKSRIHELGSGPYTLQLHTRPIQESELTARAADRQRQIAESRAFQQRRAAQVCRRCVRQREECRDGRHRPFGGSCLREFDLCLSRSSIRAGECPY